MTHLIKIYQNHDKGSIGLKNFLDDISKTLIGHRVLIGIHYKKGEIFFSLDSGSKTYSVFESQFYAHFKDYQIIKDDRDIWSYDPKKSALGEIGLVNGWFFPFKMSDDVNRTDFVYNIFRAFENFDLIQDNFSFFIEIKPIVNESLSFFIKSKFRYKIFRRQLLLTFYKYMFNVNSNKNWKHEGHLYFKDKLHKNLFETKIFMIAKSDSKGSAQGKIQTVYNKFLVFKNYPKNQFKLKIRHNFKNILALKNFNNPCKNYILSSDEISKFFQFPRNPQKETSLLTVKARKLSLPVGIPTFNYKIANNGEIIPRGYPEDINILGISDYRSITVPVGIYDLDRLRHVYVVGKTGVGKSKFLLSLMINDIIQNRGLGIIDPHGDIISELMMHIPENRKEDVIIFDPTDEKFPFCMNPLDIDKTEEKQILAKGFIDIFKKFFGANWNSKLEHVLRMVFLALLDKPGSTLFDIIRALTDKDFRYEMIDKVEDDVIRNFWTNEFAGWSQQFNTEAIMPILNKVGQLLSIDILKNIFSSKENKIDFRKLMDEKKILLIKLPKGKLQEDIMGFLGAMFVTKLYQTALGRQSISYQDRIPFFLYVDEFQNFATDTFGEILSEARKYGLGLALAHQFIDQIPKNISHALFGNVGTLVSFRISSSDAEYMKDHFAPFLDGYDLANLNMREFYCKLLVQGQVKDPFSLKTLYMPDISIRKKYVNELYGISREKYARTLTEAKKDLQEEHKDVIEAIDEFLEPII